MSTLSQRPLLPTFLPSLNALLTALALPFAIDHPTDLTPSLLLAIFESLINARLPIPLSVRQSRTRDAQSRAMLVLLGVLECDVLRGGTDAEHSAMMSNADDSVLAGAGGVSVDGWVDEIGLGEVDPERLADGGWEETIFVGELLCWLARRKGVLPRIRSSRQPSHTRSLYSNHHSYGTEGGEGDTADFSMSLLLKPSLSQKVQSPRPASPVSSIEDPDADPDISALSHITDVPRHPLVHSPEPSLSASATTGTDLSIRARSVSSRTSVSNVHDVPDDFEGASQDTVQMYDPRRMVQDVEDDDDRPPTFRPRCIHELEDPSYVRALAGPSSSFDPSASRECISEDEDDLSRDEEDGAYEDVDPYSPPTPTPRRVRLTGWIDDVDTTAELDRFATSRTHSRSYASRTGAGSSSGQPSRLPRHTYASRAEAETPKSASTSRLKTEVSPPRRLVSSKSRTSRHASPSPSPPPLSPPLATSSQRASRCSPTYSPSPPSPTTHSDPPFDVSFSMLNNTSTPAKPRPPRHPQLPTTTYHKSDIDTRVWVDRSKTKSQGSAGTEPGIETGIGRPRLSRRDRSPSYTPSPPSFSTPRSLRTGGAGAGGSTSGAHSGTRTDSTRTTRMDTKTRSGVVVSARSTSPPLSPPTIPIPSSTASKKGKSPPPTIPTGSTTATTNTLLTERARLLTELATLKRVRAASVGRSSRGTVGQRLGVGV